MGESCNPREMRYSFWRTSLHANVTKKTNTKKTRGICGKPSLSLGQAPVPPRFQPEATVGILKFQYKLATGGR